MLSATRAPAPPPGASPSGSCPADEARVLVRRAQAADHHRLAALFDAYRQFYGFRSDLDAARAFIAARLEHGDSQLLLVCAGDEPAGFAQLYPSYSSLQMRRMFHLNDLFVPPPWRRRGVARRLLEAARTFAVVERAAYLALETAAANLAAQRLYASAGWVRDEKVLHYCLDTRIEPPHGP
jgi:ribosomal protein S18 acetylase RimI-like enzyme